MQVNLHLDAPDGADAEELDDLTRRLRQQILQLDVDSVEHVSGGAAPPGARVVDVMLIGSLLVTLSKSPELLKMVVGTVEAWAGRNRCSIELQIGGDSLKVSGISSDQQQQLINTWVTAHSK